MRSRFRPVSSLFAVFVAVFLLLLSGLGAQAAELSLTPEEQAYIAANPTFRAANETDWPPFDFYEFGHPKGLGIDFIRLIAQKAGLNIEFINGYTWAELVEMFKEKKIDVMPVFYVNEQRKPFTLYTPAYYRGKLGIFTDLSGVDVQDVSELPGKRIGIQKAHGAIPIIEEQAPGIELTEYGSNETMVKDLATGKLDAIIGNPLLFSYYSRENQITTLRLAGYVEMEKEQQERTSLHIGVRRDRPVLHSILQKAMAAVTDQEMQVIEDRWTTMHLREKRPERIPLTSAELAFLAAHPIIRASNEMDYPPFDFAVGERPTGYSIDLLNMLAERIGLNIKYVNGYSWNELVGLFKQGKLDLLHTLIRSKEREKFGIFSSPFKRMKNHFVVRRGAPDIYDIRQLSGKTVAVGKGWSTTNYIANNHPDVKLLVVNSMPEMLEAVSLGEADATIGDAPVVSYYLLKHDLDDLKISGWYKNPEKEGARKLHFFAQKSAPELISMLNKAYAALEPEDLEKLDRKWIGEAEQSLLKVNLTREEQQFVIDHPGVVLGGGVSFEPYIMTKRDGGVRGFDVDVADLISKRTGLDIRFELGIWKDIQQKAQARKLDGLTAAISSEERRKYYTASAPYISLSNLVIVKSGNPKGIHTVQDLSGKSVAIQEGNILHEQTAKEQDADITIIYVKTLHDTIRAVASGKADFTILDDAAFYIARKLGLSGMIEGAFPIGEQFSLHFLLRNDWPELVDIVNKGLDSITEQEKLELRNRWFGVLPEDHERIELSRDEQMYLSGKESITICVRNNMAPLEHMAPDGAYEGMVADFMDIFAKRSGLKIQPIPATSQAQALAFAKAGRCDAISLVEDSSAVSELLDVTSPYLTFPLVLAAKQERFFITDLADALDQTFAVTRENATLYEDKLPPGVSLLEVRDALEGIEKVRANEVFGYLDTSLTMGYFLQKQGAADLKISGSFPHSTIALGVGVRKDAPQLREIFQKAVSSLSEADKLRVKNKWISVTFQQGIDYTLVWQFLAGVAVVLFGVLYWNRKLHHERKRAQQALSALHDAQKKLEEKNQELARLSITDGLTGLFNRAKLDQDLEQEMSRFRRYGGAFGVILLDIDHFKSVNDVHGHQVGDQVLKMIAAQLKEHTRESDIAGRWGGEEFLVICPQIDRAGVLQVAEKLRSAIKGTEFSTVGSKTASFGVTLSQEGDKIRALIARADKALYVAKNRGRDRVEYF